MDCRPVVFLPEKSEERINRALQVFPRRLLMRVLAFALYLLGASRKAVAALVEMPEESVKTAVRIVLRDGFSALRDRRSSRTEAPHVAHPSTPMEPRISARREGPWCRVDFGPGGKCLQIPLAHPIQVRTVVLSLLNAGLVSAQESASVLGICAAHCRGLARKLASRDVAESLVDQRQGQQHDYRVGLEQKAELIQQLAARAVTGHSTSSEVLAKLVNERTQAKVSARAIRWHISHLGLAHTAETLPRLVESLKKTPDDCSSG